MTDQDTNPATILRVCVPVNPAAAIAAGYSAYGDLPLDLDLAELTAEERREVADAVADYERQTTKGTRYPPILHRAVWSYHVGEGYVLPPMPLLSHPSQEGARSLLQAAVARGVVVQAYEQARRVKWAVEWEAAQRAWLAKPDDELLYRYGEPAKDLTLAWSPGAATGAVRLGNLPEYDARVEALRGRLLELQLEAERQKDERALARAQAAAQAAAQHQAQWQEWLECYGTASMRRRHEAGLLREDELLAVVRDVIFAPLDDLPRFQRLTEAEVRAEFGADDEAEVSFGSHPAEAVTEAEWTSLERIQALLAGRPHFKAALVQHYGEVVEDDEDEDRSLPRMAVRVTWEQHGWKFSREYAAP